MAFRRNSHPEKPWDSRVGRVLALGHDRCSAEGVRSSVETIRVPLVLVVEDEPESADLLRMILEREGCQVIVARDGASALESARELPAPDLVLLDLELPGGMDGRALLDAMRSDPSLSGIPVVVVSGAPDALKVRATDNLGKAGLLDGIQRVLARVRSRDTNGASNSVPGAERSAQAG